MANYDYYNQQYSGFQQHMSNFLASDLSSLSIYESSMAATTNGYYPGDYAGGFAPPPPNGKKTYPNQSYYPKRSSYYQNGSYASSGAAAPTATAYNAELIDSKYNAKDFQYNGEAEGKADSRFFIIKSYSKEDVMHAVHHNLWCSTEGGNAKLDAAFAQKTTNPHVSVYLFFSVNGSGQFCGMAEMVSPVDFSAKCPIWTQDKWKGKFEIKWVYVKDIPNNKFKHVLLPNNEGKPVTNSRDCQEVLFEQAVEVLNVFRTYNHRTTILDDVEVSQQFDAAATATTKSSATPSESGQNKDYESTGGYKHKPYSYRQQKMHQNGSYQASTTNGYYDLAPTNSTSGFQVKRVLNRGADYKKKFNATNGETTDQQAASTTSAQNETTSTVTVNNPVALTTAAATSD